MKTYSQIEASEKLNALSLKDWKFDTNSLQRQFIFKDFREAMNFMMKAGDIAEELNHHPDWSNVYNRVNVHLSTHDAGGVTDKDFELAKRMNSIG